MIKSPLAVGSCLPAVLAVVVGVSLAACASPSGSAPAACLTTKDVRDRATELDGKEIEVCGYLRYAFENDNLFGSVAQARRHDRDRCLSVGMAGGAEPPLELYDQKWVRLKGKVTADICGPDAICFSSCSEAGVYVRSVEPLR